MCCSRCMEVGGLCRDCEEYLYFREELEYGANADDDDPGPDDDDRDWDVYQTWGLA